MTKEINIKPEMGIYNVFRYLKYQPWFAISEFIDNSLQSFLNQNPNSNLRREKCKVIVSYQKEKILIKDNSFGILEEEHSRAFTAGIPPSNKKGLSEFGIGMKSAAIWFAPKWKIKTQPYKSDIEFEYFFDLNKIINSDGNIKSLKKKSNKEKGFTEIELIDIYYKPNKNLLNKIKRNLESIYRQFIREDILEIKFNKEFLRYREVEILKDYFFMNDINNKNNKNIFWKKNINFRLSNNANVNGFLGLRKSGSIEDSGLSLFRRKRLILGNYKNLYKPKLIFGLPNSIEYQRIFGEINIDGINVSHTKDDFNFGIYEDEFIEKLKCELEDENFPLLQQAKNYRLKEFDEKSLSFIIKEMEYIIDKLNNKMQLLIDSINFKKSTLFKVINKNKFRKISEKEVCDKYLTIEKILKFNLNNNLFNINFGIDNLGSGNPYEVFLIENYSNNNRRSFKYYVIFNKKYKLLIENNKLINNLDNCVIKNFFATSISQIILLNINNNNILKDRFLTNSIINITME